VLENVRNDDEEENKDEDHDRRPVSLTMLGAPLV
jgi:hypothetical protein